MKRFISYLYTYENGIKGKNIGFIKTDIRNQTYKMEIHVRGLGRYEGKGRIFLLQEHVCRGIEIGYIGLHMGMGSCCLTCEPDQLFQKEQSDAPVGIAIKSGRQYYAVSFWKDQSKEEYLFGTFEIEEKISDDEAAQGNPGESEEDKKKKKINDKKLSEDSTTEKYNENSNARENEEERVIGKLSSSQAITPPEETVTPSKGAIIPPEGTATPSKGAITPPEETVTPSKGAITPPEETEAPQKTKASASSRELDDNSKTECSRCEKQEEMESGNKTCDTPPAIVKKIDIHAIRSLPKRNWYLCNNSFLIHGFMNYHHLILKSIQDNGVQKMYLGVPGVYEKPERVMAMLFGFSEFEDEKHLICNKIGNPEDEMQDGMFGYWFCLLDT